MGRAAVAACACWGAASGSLPEDDSGAGGSLALANLRDIRLVNLALLWMLRLALSRAA